MKSMISAAILMTLLGAGTVLAGDDQCKVPKDQWQPQESLQKQLENEGWDVKRVKVDNGCYEVYATTAEGKRMEAYFDPKSLQPVKVEED